MDSGKQEENLTHRPATKHMIYLRRKLGLPRSLFVRLLLTTFARASVGGLARRLYGKDFVTHFGPAAHAF